MTIVELNNVGIKVAKLLQIGCFEEVASEYGYAFSFDKDSAIALKEDFEKACNEALGDISTSKFIVKASYFKENEAGLTALIECDFPMEHSTGVFVELILNLRGLIYLEQISSYCGAPNA